MKVSIVKLSKLTNPECLGFLKHVSLITNKVGTDVLKVTN